MIKILIFLIRLMPHKISLSFGRLIGRILRLVLWKKTDRCEARCVEALGVGVTIAREIIKRSYMNLGMSAIEFIRFPKMFSDVKKYMSVDDESIKLFRDSLSKGNGIIFIVAHMDNWELAAMRMINEGFELNAVYTPQKNKGGINDEIMRIRTEIIKMKMTDNKGAGLREIFRTLKNNGSVVIMQDLDARKDGIITNFLGLPASTHDGVIKLHERFNSPVIGVKCTRDKNYWHHELKLREIKDISLEGCNKFIEDMIKENPDLWLWLMDRWEYTKRKNLF